MMDDIGTFTPEQARMLWQDFQTRRQLPPQVSQGYPQRREIDEVSPHRVFVSNQSGEEIPAYGCLQITGTTETGGRTTITVTKPSSTSGEFVFNSQFSIASGGVGWAYRFGIVVALGSSPSTANVIYEPTVGAWTITESDPDSEDGFFTVFGTHNASANGLIGRFADSGGTGSSGTVNLLHGIVNESLTRGYYTVEIADWNGATPEEGEVPDICLDATGSTSGSGDDNCDDIVLPDFEPQTIGTAVYVLAYDPTSVLVPLEVGSDCLLADVGDENATGSTSDSSASSGSTEPVYQIVRGYQTHVTAYDKEYECCNGVWTLITKKAYIFAAKECTAATCDVCE